MVYLCLFVVFFNYSVLRIQNGVTRQDPKCTCDTTIAFTLIPPVSVRTIQNRLQEVGLVSRRSLKSMVCTMVLDELGRGGQENFQSFATLSKKFRLLEVVRKWFAIKFNLIRLLKGNSMFYLCKNQRMYFENTHLIIFSLSFF